MTEIDEILAELEFFSKPFPAAAVAAAIEHQEEITPRLLSIVAAAAEDPEPFGEEERSDHVFALYLLAKFREQRAWPMVQKILSAPDGGEEMLGDIVPQSMDSIMASLCGGDLAGIRALIENPAINQNVRWVAVSALTRLVVAGSYDRDEAMQYFAGLFRTLPREHNDVWDGLGFACLDLCPEEVIADLALAREEGLIDERSFHQSDIDEALARGKTGAVEYLRQASGSHALVDDLENEMAWMAAFDESAPGPTPASQGADTVVRTGPKVGRNDPCPCGSGKKFKKCCLI